MKQDERAIIIRILNGDQESYGLLINRYKEGLYRHCFKFVHDEDWAEDIAQEAFIKAYLQLNTYDPHYQFSTWLYKIASNLASDQLRRKRTVPLDKEMQLISTLAATDQKAKDDELHRLVDELPEKYRAVLVMHYWEGRGYEEIARRLNTTVGSIKGWANRAKSKLRRSLL